MCEVEVKDYYCHCYVCEKVFLAMAREFVKEESTYSWLILIEGKTDGEPYLCVDCFHVVMTENPVSSPRTDNDRALLPYPQTTTESSSPPTDNDRALLPSFLPSYTHTRREWVRKDT